MEQPQPIGSREHVIRGIIFNGSEKDVCRDFANVFDVKRPGINGIYLTVNGEKYPIIQPPYDEKFPFEGKLIHLRVSHRLTWKWMDFHRPGFVKTLKLDKDIFIKFYLKWSKLGEMESVRICIGDYFLEVDCPDWFKDKYFR